MFVKKNNKASKSNPIVIIGWHELVAGKLFVGRVSNSKNRPGLKYGTESKLNNAISYPFGRASMGWRELL